MEKAVYFKNSNGCQLFGIVHIPNDNTNNYKQTGIILLNPGIKYRVAPNRLNVKIARMLCDTGYHVFRFDPEGIGDSDGDKFTNERLSKIAEEIQKGALVSDTVAACEFFIKMFKFQGIILLGNCGGAVTALLSSKIESRITRLILIDLPIQFKKYDYTFADKVTAGGRLSNRLLSLYFKKLLSIKAWLRLLTFKTNYRALYTLIKNKIATINFFLSNNDKISEDLTIYCRDNGLNVLLFNAIKCFTEKGNKILFVLAGNDKSTEFFTKFFWNGYLIKNQELEKKTEKYLIKNANHIYTLSEWQQSLISKVTTWIKNNINH